MVSKNNRIERIEKDAEKQSHFGIRKLTIGAASVLLSTTIWLGGNANVTKADTNNDNGDLDQASEQTSTSTSSGISETEKVVVVKNDNSTAPSTPKANTSNSHNNDVVDSTTQNNSEKSADSTPTAESQTTSEKSPDNTTDLEKAAQTQVEHAIKNTQQSTPVTQEDNSDEATKINQAAQAGKQSKKNTDLSKVALEGLKTNNASSGKADNQSDKTENKNVAENTNITIPETGKTTFELTPKAENEAKIAANLYGVNFAQQNGFGSILDNIKKLNSSQVKQAIDQVKTNLSDPDVQKFANDLLTGKTGSLLIDGLKAKGKLTNSINEMQNIIKQVTGTNDETKKDPTDPAQADGSSDLISKLKDFKLPNIDPTKISGAVKDLSNNLKDPQVQNLINSLSSGNPIKIGMAAISAKTQIENSLNDVQSIAQQITGNKNAGASLDKLKDITKIDPEKALNAFKNVSSILQDPAIKNVMGDVVTGNTTKLISDGIKAIPVITKNVGNLQTALQEITGDKNSGAILDKIKDLKLPNIDPNKLEKIAQDATNIAKDPAIQKLAKDLITGNTVGILPDIINAGKNGNLDNVKDIIQQVTGNTDSASWLDKLGKLNLPKVDMDQLNKIVQGISSTVKDPAVQQLAKDLISGNTANIIPDLIKAGPTLAKNFGNVQDIINKIIGNKGQQGDHTKPDTDHPTSWFDKFKNLIPSFTDEEKTAAKNAVNRAITNPGVSNLVMDVVTGNTPKLLIDVIHYGPSVLKDAYTSTQEIIKAVKDACAQKPDDKPAKPDETKNGSVVITVHDNTDNQDLSEYTYNSGEEKVGTKVEFDKAGLISKLQAAGYKVVNGDVSIPAEITEGTTNITIYVEKAETPKPVEEKKGSLIVTVHDSDSKQDLTEFTYTSGEEKVGTKINFDKAGLINKLQSAGYKVVNADVNIPVEITEGSTNVTIYVEKAEKPKPAEEKKGSLTVTVHDSDSKQDLTEFTYNSGEEKVGTKVDFDKTGLINKLQAAGYRVINDDVNVPSEISEGSTNVTIYVEKAEKPKPAEEKKGSLTVTVHDSDSKQDLTEFTYNSGEEKVGTKVDFDKASLISKLQSAGYKVINDDISIPSEISEGATNVIIYVEKTKTPKPVEEKKGSLTVTVHDSESKQDLSEFTYNSGEEKVGTKVNFDKTGLINKLQSAGYKVVNADVNIPAEIVEGPTNITIYVEKTETPKPVEEKKGSLTVIVHDSDSKQDLTQYTYTSGEEKVGTKVDFDKIGLINKLQSAGYKVVNADVNIPVEITEGSTNVTIYVEKAEKPKPAEEKKGSLTITVRDTDNKQDLSEFTYNSGEEKVGTKVNFDKTGLINKLQSAGYKVVNADVNIPAEIVEGPTNITIYVEKAETPKPVEEKKGSLTVIVHDSDSKQDLTQYTYTSGEEKVGTKVDFDKAHLINKLQSAGYRVINADVNVPSEITEGPTNVTIYVEKAEEPKPVEEKKGSLTVTVHDSDSKQDLTQYTYTSGEEKVGTKVDFDKTGLISKLQSAGYKVINADVNIPAEIVEGPTNITIYVEKTETPKPVEEKKGSLTVIVHDSDNKQNLAQYTYASGEEKVGTKVDFDKTGLINKLQSAGYKVVNADVNVPSEITEGPTNITIYVEKTETPKPVEEKKGSLTVIVHDSDSKQDLPEFTYTSGEEKVGTKVDFDKTGLINKLQSAGYKVVNADINIPAEITEGSTNITLYVEKAEKPKPAEEKKGSLTITVHNSDSKQDLTQYTYTSGEERVGTKVGFDKAGLISKLQSAGYKVINDDVNIPSEITEGTTNITIYVEKTETPKPVEEKKGSLTITVHDSDSKQDLPEFTYNSGEEKVGTKVNFDKTGLINKLQSARYKVVNADVNIPAEIVEGPTNITIYVEKAETPKPVEEKKGSLTVTVHDSDNKQDLTQYTYTSGEEKVGTKVEFDKAGLINKLQSAGYKVVNADINIPAEITEGSTNVTIYVEKAETPKPAEEKKGSLTVTVRDSDNKQDLTEFTYNSGEEKVGTKINFDKAALISELQVAGYKVVNADVNIPSEISEGSTNITIYVEKVEKPQPAEEKKGSLTVTVHDTDSKQDLPKFAYNSGEEKVGTKVNFDKAALISELQVAGYKVVNADVNIPSEISEGSTNITIYVEKVEKPQPAEEKKGSLTVTVHDTDSKQDLPKFTYNSGEEKVGTKINFDKTGLINKLQAAGYKVINDDISIPSEISEGPTTITLYVEKVTNPNSTQNHSESSNDISGNTPNNGQTSSNNSLTDQTATRDQPLNTSNENQTSNQSASTINSEETTPSSNNSQATSTEDNSEDLNDENESPSYQSSDLNDENSFVPQSSEQKSNNNYYDKNRAPHSLKGNNFANIDKEITVPSKNVISTKTEIVGSGNTAHEMNYKRGKSDDNQLPKTGKKDSDSTIMIGAVATSLSLLGLMGVKKQRED